MAEKDQYYEGSSDIKIVLVGNGAVGKTCLLQTFLTRIFTSDWAVDIFETYHEDITVDGKNFHLVLNNMCGLNEMEPLRKCVYIGVDCVFVCYAVDNEYSLSSVIEDWVPEVRKQCPNVPIIIVAMKIDLRSDNLDCITFKKGMKVMKEVGADGFVECSARLGYGIKDPFIKAVQLLNKPKICHIS